MFPFYLKGTSKLELDSLFQPTFKHSSHWRSFTIFSTRALMITLHHTLTVSTVDPPTWVLSWWFHSTTHLSVSM